ncbi:bifunctional protein-serine/threonine kinase/phosphatase [Roseibium salinum]|uniref:Bifunctional protein-serine/threonine kinase/phosphatase n=1 Tax=Roseibium salinum TaxID=1604349 RepID=A0ABT3QZR8_9HYPH|nr:bifunctional protein-serine/threonine kinase/phosphatase [Roseibium sp. DSM 29163]MCX2722333.1 bifunctional protein-serine/threonine kinase/phosphatase [Roseibium sp. DSM 29163]
MGIETGQYSAAGRKQENQDFHGALVPVGQVLVHKGVALAIADGISSSPDARIAAETAVKSFLSDYYCTSEAWSVKTAGSRVISATNSWLFGQTRQASSRDLGHVCTFSALVLKGRRAHLFHAGDSRIWRLSGQSLEQLTEDHRVRVSPEESYLARGLGLAQSIDLDYLALDLKAGDIFVLTTDGVHEFLPPKELAARIAGADDLDAAAKAAVELALEAGSTDNLTIQIARVTRLPEADAPDFLAGGETLPPAPLPRVPGHFEGYRLCRNLHSSSRSHIYLAEDEATGDPVVLKFPSVDLRGENDYLRRFALEEWIARRISSPHVLKAAPYPQERETLFVATEYVEGQTLRQWMTDNPHPDLETVRGLLEQIARGLRAFHRKEMVHQDLRPENIMIDKTGTVKIIDFGSVRIAGVIEAAPALDKAEILGTHQYTAPEVFLGYLGTERSDLFSLGVIAYEMLTGRLPYGAAVARATSEKAQAALRFRSASSMTERVPDWVDGALCRAVHPVPGRRYEVLSEFLEDLRRPNAAFTTGQFVPLAERDPVRFWQLVSAVLAVLCAVLFYQLFGNS